VDSFLLVKGFLTRTAAIKRSYVEAKSRMGVLAVLIGNQNKVSKICQQEEFMLAGLKQRAQQRADISSSELDAALIVSNLKSIASSNHKKLTYENRLDAAEVDRLSKHEREAKTTTVQVQIARLINLLTTSEQIQIEDQLRKDIAIVEGYVADLSLPALKKEVTHEQRNPITKLAAMMSSPSQLLACMHGTAPAPGAKLESKPLDSKTTGHLGQNNSGDVGRGGFNVEEMDEKQLRESLINTLTTRCTESAHAHLKEIRNELKESVSVTRATAVLGHVTFDDYVRAASIDPVYKHGTWAAAPGGRWYIWNRWWMGEKTEIFIGEHIFKFGLVRKCGIFCRQREHLASHSDDLVWLHSSKKGRSCPRLLGWLFTVVKIVAVISLVVSITWNVAYPECDTDTTCANLRPAIPIDFGNCESECAVTKCSDTTCSMHGICQEYELTLRGYLGRLRLAYQTLAVSINQTCTVATSLGAGLNETAIASAAAYSISSPATNAAVLSNLLRALSNATALAAVVSRLGSDCVRAHEASSSLGGSLNARTLASFGPVCTVARELVARVDTAATGAGRVAFSAAAAASAAGHTSSMATQQATHAAAASAASTETTAMSAVEATAVMGPICDSAISTVATANTELPNDALRSACDMLGNNDDAEAAAYRAFLRVEYFQSWLGLLSLAGERQCQIVAAVEKCSACSNVSKCNIATSTYPSATTLCAELRDVFALQRSEFCMGDYSQAGNRPCLCVPVWRQFLPNTTVFWISMVCLLPLVSAIVTFIWARWLPEILDLALTGMRYSHSTSGFIMPPGESIYACIDLLETKLGRTVSLKRIHKPWGYTPACFRCGLFWSGFHEELVVYEDCVHLSTHEGVPFCCSKRCSRWCCCDADGMWADHNNYFMLLESVNFIECGSESFALMDWLSRFFLKFAAFLLFAEWVFAEPFIMLVEVVHFMYGNGDIWSVNSGLSITHLAGTADLAASAWQRRYSTGLPILFVLYTICRIAGHKCLKRGYVCIHCLPGGTDRGRASRYVGRSPFFVRMPHANPAKYADEISDIRAAVRRSRMQGRARRRQRILREFAAVTKSSTANKFVMKLKQKQKETNAAKGRLLNVTQPESPAQSEMEFCERPKGSVFARSPQHPRWVHCSVHLGYAPPGLQEQAQMCSLKYTEKKDSDPAPREEYDPIDEQDSYPSGSDGQISAVGDDIVEGEIDIRTVDSVQIEQLDEESGIEGESTVPDVLVIRANSHKWEFRCRTSEDLAAWHDRLHKHAKHIDTAEGIGLAKHRAIRKARFIINNFIEEGIDIDDKLQRQEIGSLFLSIDRGHTNRVQADQFIAYLKNAVKGNHQADMAIVLSCEQKINEYINHVQRRRGLTLNEFWDLMMRQPGGVAEVLRSGGLWQYLMSQYAHDRRWLNDMFDYLLRKPGDRFLG
jgi:hypothetical protein